MSGSASAAPRKTEESRKKNPKPESPRASSTAPGWNGVPLHAIAGDPLHAPPGALLALQRAVGNRMVQRLLAEQLQRTEAPGVGAAGGELDASLQSEVQSARGAGHPLDANTGRRLGQTLGVDVGGVRVHADARADSLSRSLNADAFTLGSDMFFRNGKYNPASHSGQKLIAHETAHVVQQGAAPLAGARQASSLPQRGASGSEPLAGARQASSLPQRGASGSEPLHGVQTKMHVGPAGDRYEREADHMASHFMSGKHAAANPTKPPSPPSGNPGQILARQSAITPATAQPAAPAGIQRLLTVSPEDFKQKTNKGALRQRGDNLRLVDGYLAQYHMYPYVIADDSDRAARQDVLGRMELNAQKWVSRHDVYGMFDTVEDKSGGKKVTNDDDTAKTKKAQARQTAIKTATNKEEGTFGKSRQDTYLTMIGYLEDTFIPDVKREKSDVTKAPTAIDIVARGKAPVQDPLRANEEQLAKQKLAAKSRKNNAMDAKLKERYENVSTDTGTLFGSVIPGILNLMAPGPGDLGKFTFEVQVPLEAAHVPWFVGGKIYLEGERKESNEFKSKFKASFKTGPRFVHASLYGEIGAQIEGQAQTPEEVSKLFSYGMYRRFRESSVVPRGVTNMMWGGAKGTQGYLGAEKWAGQVEEDVLGTGDNVKKAYVDLGGYGGVGGGVEFTDDIKAVGSFEAYAGRRYNKHTVETAKGKLGKTQFTKQGPQSTLGQKTRRFELGGAVSAKMGIGGSGDFKLKWDLVKGVKDPTVPDPNDPNKKITKTGYKGKYKTQKAELEVNVLVNIPVGGSLVEKIAIPAGVAAAGAVRNIVQVAKSEKKAKMMAGLAVDGLEEAAGSFERNIEVNQIAGHGFLADTGNVSAHGVHSANSTVAGSGSSAGTGGGAKVRVKFTRENEFDLFSGKWKLQGDLYSVNKLGASFAGNKLLVDKSTRLALLKWETGGKMKWEILGFAWKRELEDVKDSEGKTMKDENDQPIKQMKVRYEKELKAPAKSKSQIKKDEEKKKKK